MTDRFGGSSGYCLQVGGCPEGRHSDLVTFFPEEGFVTRVIALVLLCWIVPAGLGLNNQIQKTSKL